MRTNACSFTAKKLIPHDTPSICTYAPHPAGLFCLYYAFAIHACMRAYRQTDRFKVVLFNPCTPSSDQSRSWRRAMVLHVWQVGPLLRPTLWFPESLPGLIAVRRGFFSIRLLKMLWVGCCPTKSLLEAYAFQYFFSEKLRHDWSGWLAQNESNQDWREFLWVLRCALPFQCFWELYWWLGSLPGSPNKWTFLRMLMDFDGYWYRLVITKCQGAWHFETWSLWLNSEVPFKLEKLFLGWIQTYWSVSQG